MSIRLNPTAARPARPSVAAISPPSKVLVFFSKLSSSSSLARSRKFHGIGRVKWEVAVQNTWQSEEEGSSVDEVDDSPASVGLSPISDESQFDRVIAEAQQLEESVIFVWMATWCRKCIYLKPKLEKLAAKYYPRLRFYCVDVNAVPHKLVSRAGVTKMPTIQLWKEGKKQAEVIGGHKAYLVVNEVAEMIENESTV